KTIPDDIRVKLYTSILYYGNLETSRPNVGGRFHRSCFSIPNCATNTYFCLLSIMELIENGTTTDALSIAANAKLKALGMQTWTQPYRNDATDANVVSVERFRNHVWWVGGNAIAYRCLLPVAVMHRSAAMINVISQVAIGALSTVSQTTYDTAFWIEGFTTDGAGWGHGKQCLIWGYPADGASTALDLLNTLSSTPWLQKLDRGNTDAVLNYIRRSAFFYHNGYVPPLFDRTNAIANKAAANIKTASIAAKLLNNFSSSLTTAEITELNQFKTEATSNKINMTGYPNGNYNGSRYFFNNDDLIKKDKSYMVLINMTSSRTYGLESAIDAANGFNLYSCDGTTLYQRSGDEYVKAIGAMNQSALPGITARQINNSALVGITHWGGFNSKHNFAAGATSFGTNFAGGFILEKQDAPASDAGTSPNNQNPAIYGVKAYKGYFMFDDIMVVMGAGITNLKTSLAGNIVTSVEQTLRKPDLAVNGTPVTATTYTEILKTATDNTAATKWVLNNGFAFGVMPAYTTGEVKLTAETRNTIWQTLAPTLNTAAETTQPMMQLQIDHGKSVTNGTYLYMVSATGIVPAQLPKIISNTTSLQAAAAADSSVIGAVFYDNSKGFTFGKYSYSLSSPVALLIENYNFDSITVTVTDATMNSALLKTTLTTTLPISGTDVTKTGNNYTLAINLPQGELCGSPVTVKIKRIKTSTDIQSVVTDLNIKIIGRTIYFPSVVNQLSVFNSLGVNIVKAQNLNSCVLPTSGVYLLKIDGRIRKIIVGKN
ncbi:MAG: polysaccharide lyase family 8 super-sandwich domain-containing protein, partial [Paludibacter sp.]